jgi:hypothetical protein
MELDDFFGNKRQDQRGYPDQRYQDSPNYSQNLSPSYQRQNSNYKMLHFLAKLKTDKKLKTIVVFAVILTLGIFIAIIWALLPLLLKLFNYINQNGLQGIVDYVTSFLDKIWKGLGK